MGLDDLLQGGGGWAVPGNSITLPPDATEDQPRIYIGPDDPIATALGQDAAIVLYWGDGRAFIISVDQSGGLPTFGQLRMSSFDPVNGLSQYIDFDCDMVAGETHVFVGLNLVNGIVHIGSTGSATTRIQVENETFTRDTFNVGDPLYGRQLFQVLNLAGSAANINAIMEGHSQLSRWRESASSPANSAAVAAPETVVLTSGSTDWKAGRAYRVVLETRFQSAAANGTVLFNVRKTNLAGQLLGTYSRYSSPLAGFGYAACGSLVFTVGAADVTGTIALTMQGTAANAITQLGAAGQPRSFTVEDLGDAAQYPDVTVLV